MWSIEFHDKAESEFYEQPEDIQSQFDRIINRIKSRGLHTVRKPHVGPLGNKLWEMRARGKDGIARAIYIAYVGKRVIILRVFSKKEQKTPRREIKLAFNRAKEIRDGTADTKNYSR